MKTPFLITAFCLAFAFALPQRAHANLVQDGNFTSVTYTQTTPTLTTLFGQFGTDTTGSPASGSTLTVANWTTGGYNFVYAPNTADSGTNATGGAGGGRIPGHGYPNEAPGQYNGSTGYGDTYLWGTHNSGLGTMTGTAAGTGTIDAAPGGGNFIAMDGVYEQDSVSQTITGLTVGKLYALTFYWAGAQQQSFTGITTEWLTGSLGGSTFTTGTVTLPSESFSGWYQDTVYLTATSTSETLSFLAGGTPSGEPPFSLLSNVDLEVIPELSNWMVFAGFGMGCLLFEAVRRRRRRRSELASSANGTSPGSFTAPVQTAPFSGAAKPPVSA